ncbi:MAG: hypothetical protein PHG47_10760 [Sulfuricella sp.]|nr:hypothetical protein [Sulfuricella sp.]
MPTTSLKLSETLKNRVTNVAKIKGTNPHAFMLDAIERVTLAAERRAAFVDEALAARKEMQLSGTGYPAGEVHDYLERRLRGEPVVRPEAVSWRK